MQDGGFWIYVLALGEVSPLNMCAFMADVLLVITPTMAGEG